MRPKVGDSIALSSSPWLNFSYEMNPTAEWFVFLESDTYFVWDNLFRLLDHFDPSVPLYFWIPVTGERRPRQENFFAYGGAGFVLSAAAIDKLVARKIGSHGEYIESPLSKRYEELLKADPCGDSVLGWALHERGVQLSGLWPMFNPHPLHGIPFDNAYWCQPVISMHKSLLADMEALVKWEHKRDREGTMERQNDWDNGDWGGFQEPRSQRLTSPSRTVGKHAISTPPVAHTPTTMQGTVSLYQPCDSERQSPRLQTCSYLLVGTLRNSRTGELLTPARSHYNGPHPLAILTEEETNIARDVVVSCHPNTVIDFHEIYLLEPPKVQLSEFLALEHAGRLSPTTLVLRAWPCGLCFARDASKKNDDANFYSYPLPVIPVMDAHTQEIIRVDRPATGGKGEGTRKDLKPLNVVQPEGPSFRVTNESLVEWQKWRFRVGFNPREGATIHDVWYDGRSVMYRLAINRAICRPRPPFHRKQAFDFGDGGGGNMANNLSIGRTARQRSYRMPSACTRRITESAGNTPNWRTGRAVVTRNRELIVQFIITLANYEYVFAYKFDLAGGITVESRATGILNVVNIDAGKVSEYGNVVSGGVLAQNHQHIFCVRIDPAVDGSDNSVVVEESHPVPMNEVTNPNGNFYQVTNDTIQRAGWTIKMVNPHRINPISGKPVAYKFIPLATQLPLADPNSIQAKRAQFAQHHVWDQVPRLGAVRRRTVHTAKSAGDWRSIGCGSTRRFSGRHGRGGVELLRNHTHNPRVEDWPVMPVETFQLMIRPSDFFTANPSAGCAVGQERRIQGDSRLDSEQSTTRLKRFGMRCAMAARIRRLESSSSGSVANSAIPTSGSTISTPSNNAGLQRIMNRPQSPSYVGPTSAEFGLMARQKSVDDSDGDDFASTAAASPVAQSDTEAMSSDPLGWLGLTEALRLVTAYENSVGLMYPCVDLDSVRAYVAEYYRTDGRPGPASPVAVEQDWFFARDVEVLKIILATALLVESHGRSERAAF
ncbi:uncharacterized protein ATNIH1004_002004 [Aspergillus tanneri]|uniref:Amine oxidase n=1 Tax=Aspergillus tanneri TaxID=1220188 RepID=A0A5M9M6X9_9EURO|nr:uncharacterized protein ATNIH1004_002004 [Aspergillus tanneri]KAA8641336.1 hypothetical protein ATNIH1004_002004 [Aspergillus tanneri]